MHLSATYTPLAVHLVDRRGLPREPRDLGKEAAFSSTVASGRGLRMGGHSSYRWDMPQGPDWLFGSQEAAVAVRSVHDPRPKGSWVWRVTG